MTSVEWRPWSRVDGLISGREFTENSRCVECFSGSGVKGFSCQSVRVLAEHRIDAVVPAAGIGAEQVLGGGEVGFGDLEQRGQVLRLVAADDVLDRAPAQALVRD